VGWWRETAREWDRNERIKRATRKKKRNVIGRGVKRERVATRKWDSESPLWEAGDCCGRHQDERRGGKEGGETNKKKRRGKYKSAHVRRH